MTVGYRLRELCKEKGITEEILSSHLNIDVQTIYDWEANKSAPDLIKAKQIAELLGISLDDFFNDSDSNKHSQESLFSLDFLSGTKLMLCGELLIFLAYVFTSASILFIIGLLLFVTGLFRK